MKKQSWFIGARYNPQLNTYYVAFGQLSKKAVKEKECCLYGSMTLSSFDTEESYQAKIKELQDQGSRVTIR